MSKSYTKNPLLSSPNINIFNNLLEKSISCAHFLPLPLLKFIPLISLALIQKESVILSDLAPIIAALRGTHIDSAERLIRFALHNQNYDFHAFYSLFIRFILSNFRIKHPDNKAIVSLDHIWIMKVFIMK